MVAQLVFAMARYQLSGASDDCLALLDTIRMAEARSYFDGENWTFVKVLLTEAKILSGQPMTELPHESTVRAQRKSE
jgi:hypothetical protein